MWLSEGCVASQELLTDASSSNFGSSVHLNGQGLPQLDKQGHGSLCKSRHSLRRGSRTLTGKLNPIEACTRLPGVQYALGGTEVVSQIGKGQRAVRCPRANLGPAEAAEIAKVLRTEFSISLQQLDLTSNRLGAAGARWLAEALSARGSAPNLTDLSLDNNGLDEEAAGWIAGMLETSSCPLQRLVLSRNCLGPAGGRLVVNALAVNTTITDIDLRDTLLDVQVGLDLARVLLNARIRKIDISENSLPDSVVASIEAAMSFSPTVWSSSNVQHALAEASRLCPIAEPVNLCNAPDYFEAIARFWQDEGSVKHIMAGLHAPIAACRPTSRGPRPQSVEYKPERLRLLARMYAPWADGISLPSGRIGIHGLFILNLTPFSVTCSSTAINAHSGCLVPFPGLNVPCAEVTGDWEATLTISSPADSLSFLPQVQQTANVPLRVGEQRHELDASNDGAKSGDLRAMFSIKDYPAIPSLSYDGRRACMLTLVWAPPPRLSGVRLHELAGRFESYRRSPCATRDELPIEPNMYQAVSAWIKPETGPSQSSLAALSDFGPVDTFVSHWWGSPLKQTLEALKRHMDGGDPNQRFWICSVANNQWRVSEELGDDIDTSPFRQALACGTCKSMALMLDTDGAPLKRYWCLYEIMTVMRLRNEGRPMELDLCTPDGVINRGSVKPEVGLKVASMVAQIDVAAAECWHDVDKRMITAAINQHLGGFERMNEQIREFVADGLHIMYEGLTEEFNQTSTMLGVGRNYGVSSSSLGSESDTVAQLRAELAAKDLEIAKLQKENERFKEENARLSHEARTTSSVNRWVGARRQRLSRPNFTH